MSKKTYKYAVVGNSLSAVLTFISLSRKGHDCALFENTDDLAKFNKKSEELDNLEFSNIYKLMDKADENQALFDWACESLLEENSFELEKVVSNPKTYFEGKMSDFKGFGEFTAASLEELSNFNQLSFNRIQDSFISQVESTLETYSANIFKGAILTGINCNDETNAIDSITINGNKEFAVEQVVFCSSPKSLLGLLPAQLSDRFKQKITKARFYSQLVLDLKFAKSLETKDEHYFLYSRKEEFEPSLGYFENTSQDDTTSSQWASLIPEESTEDFEYVGRSLRNIKKQVKRAFPEGFDDIKEEKVTLLPESFGYLDISASDLKKIPTNLSISGPLTSPFSGVSADLDSAKKCLESL